MGPPAFIVPLLNNVWFRTFIAGAGFFADSYSLFITDGVTNVLKNLAATNNVVYSYYDVNGNYNSHSLYFNALCDTTINKGVHCVPVMYSNSSGGGFIPRPDTSFTSEMVPHYQIQSSDLKNGVNNAALIGSVLGQLFFGFAGDLLGRKTNFVLTSLLIILGALGSATSSAGFTVDNCKEIILGSFTGYGSSKCLPNASYNDVYFQLYFWRFLLGFGVGGEYPLASTITSESSTKKTRGRAVLAIFSMQGWGKLTAAIVIYAVVASLQVFGGPWQLDATWRFALAFGCLLNILTVYFRWHMEESDIYSKIHKEEKKSAQVAPVLEDPTGAVANSIPETAKPTIEIEDKPKPKTAGTCTRMTTTMHLLWENKYLLIGTASTWFLMDVTFYGQSLMNTTVVNSAVASTAGLNTITKLRQSLLSTIYIMLIALPGYWFAIAFIDKMGRYWMTQMGFLVSMIWFIVLGAGYNGTTGLGPDGPAAPIGFVIVYGLTYFFANFGPNSTTFIMANEGFATRIRSTAHGLSAACGKLGATTGSFGLLAFFNSYCLSSPDAKGNPLCTVGKSHSDEIAQGVVGVMGICAGVCLLGNIMTTFFLRETGHKELHEVDAESKVLKERLRLERKEINGGVSPLASPQISPVSGGDIEAGKTLEALEKPTEVVSQDSTSTTEDVPTNEGAQA